MNLTKALDLNVGDLVVFPNAVLEVVEEHRAYDEGQCIGLKVVKGFAHLDGTAYGPGQTVTWPCHAHDLFKMSDIQCGGSVAGCTGCPKHE